MPLLLRREQEVYASHAQFSVGDPDATRDRRLGLGSVEGGEGKPFRVERGSYCVRGDSLFADDAGALWERRNLDGDAAHPRLTELSREKAAARSGTTGSGDPS